MESQITLVNPSQIRLDFSVNRFTSATLSVSGVPLYKIVTPDRAGQQTEVRDVNNNEALVTIKTRDLLPDTIKFERHHGGKSVHLKKWLKKSEGPNESYAFSFETDSGTYEWRPHPEYRIALHHVNGSANPVVAYLMNDRPTPSIVMEAGTEAFRDEILASMLVVERELRGIENFQSYDLQKSLGEMQLRSNFQVLGVGLLG